MGFEVFMDSAFYTDANPDSTSRVDVDPGTERNVVDMMPTFNLCAGILEQSMGARNREGIGLSYRRASLHKLPESNPWNRLLCSLKVKNTVSGQPPSVYFPLWSRDQWF